MIVDGKWVPNSAGPASASLIEDLVAANRILADQCVLDSWGHVSVRHDIDPQRYLLSCARAPELVVPQDIMEYDLDSNPVDARGRDQYSERFIHGQIYKARPDVFAVVHNHAPTLIPYGVTGVPLMPLCHGAAFVSQGIPVYEIRQSGGITDLLIRDNQLGRSLAELLGNRPAALMRGHGATVVAPSLARVVARSIFLSLNATLQYQAMTMANGAAINYLDPKESLLIEAREGHGAGRAWEAWKKSALGNSHQSGKARQSV